MNAVRLHAGIIKGRLSFHLTKRRSKTAAIGREADFRSAKQGGWYLLKKYRHHITGAIFSTFLPRSTIARRVGGGGRRQDIRLPRTIWKRRVGCLLVHDQCQTCQKSITEPEKTRLDGKRARPFSLSDYYHSSQRRIVGDIEGVHAKPTINIAVSWAKELRISPTLRPSVSISLTTSQSYLFTRRRSGPPTFVHLVPTNRKMVAFVSAESKTICIWHQRRHGNKVNVRCCRCRVTMHVASVRHGWNNGVDKLY